MTWRNVRLIFFREVADQLRDRRTLFMVVVLPLLLYPALGIGMMQMTLLFSEQPRTVVILGAEHLPDPPLLTENGEQIRKEWFLNEGDSQKLNVVSDLPVESDNKPAETDSPEGKSSESDLDEEPPERQASLKIAKEIRLRYEEWKQLEQELGQIDPQQEPDRHAMKKGQIQALKQEMGEYFSRANFQVLIFVPEDYDEHVRRENQRLASRETSLESAPPLHTTTIRNTADEKSLIAYGRVREARDNWERAILDERLEQANLPSDLTQPVKEELIDLAQEEQIAANVWSKLFPAMLVIMAMTGAFYPAVDLGAGEKERGTMETLLICPALRSEIVIGKFLTVLVFSLVTALLNLVSMGMTGLHLLNTAAGSQLGALGNSALPGMNVLIWVGIMAIPLAALFAALSLAFALFAKSTKEGQYYLTPLLTVTMGLTVFCLSPAVEITPFYSLIPVMGPALLLKGMLLSTGGSSELLWYVPPVLISSIVYSGLALAWAIDQFHREQVLFREAERFDLRIWIRHLLRDKERLPNFSESIFCFVLIMLLQFALLKTFSSALQAAAPGQESWTMLRLLVVQQLVIIACPALFMGILLTSRPLLTFQLRIPRWQYLLLGLALPLILHPLIIELAVRLAWFFPALPEHARAAMAAMSDGSIHWFWIVLAFAVAPAICEEIAFRGFILAGFRKTGRHYLAVVFSGILFGVMHMIPQQVFNASLLGLLLGLLVIKSGSILPAMLFHFANNALGVLHGNLSTIRQSSSVVKTLTVEDRFGVHYPLWLVALAFVIALPLIVDLIRRPTHRTDPHS